MKIFIQVYDENKVCKFDGLVADVPEDVFYPSGDKTAVTFEGVKTALDYHMFQQEQKATKRI